MAETLSLKIGPKRYRKVTKPTAKKLFEKGEDILVCACKMNPSSLWRPFTVANKRNSWYCDFEKFINEFTFYNCNAETGRYPHFYVEEKENAHT